MSDSLTAEASITVNATAARVWKALTDPRQIKKYLFGTETTTDWKRGSPITQDNNPTKESKEHSESNWGQVLQSFKNVVEK